MMALVLWAVTRSPTAAPGRSRRFRETAFSSRTWPAWPFGRST